MRYEISEKLGVSTKRATSARFSPLSAFLPLHDLPIRAKPHAIVFCHAHSLTAPLPLTAVTGAFHPVFRSAQSHAR